MPITRKNPLAATNLEREARKILPLLRKAVQLRAMSWDAQRAIQAEMLRVKPIAELDEYLKMLTVAIHEPTDAAVRRMVKLAHARRLVEEVRKGLR